MIEAILKNYIKEGDKILLALSGGPDSVFLFHELRGVCKDLNFSLECAHLHHSIREEAEEDMVFVKKLCENYHIPLHIRKVDIPAVAQREKLSIEEAGRKERYAFFYELAGEKAMIAMGHHKQDQVETILMRMIRGTGIYGLSGMKVREGQLFRPMLSLTKDEILSYLREHGYNYCIDHTNEMPIYWRNEIRLSLMPSLKKYNPKVEEAIFQLGHQAAEVESYFKEMGVAFLREQGKHTGASLEISANALRSLHPALRHRVYFYILDEIGASRQNISTNHVENLDQLLEKQSGRKIDLPGGIVARISYDSFILSTEEESRDLSSCFLEEGSRIYGDYRIRVSRDGPSSVVISELNGVMIRSRKPGDRIVMPYGHKKVKDLFIDEKIDRARREKIPLFEKNGVIFYIPGLYVNREFMERQEANYFIQVEEIE